MNSKRLLQRVKEHKPTRRAPQLTQDNALRSEQAITPLLGWDGYTSKVCPSRSVLSGKGLRKDTPKKPNHDAIDSFIPV